MEEVKLAQDLLNELTFGQDWAERETDCLRKGVGCSLGFVENDRFRILRRAYNGPSREGQVCTNVVGGCGCSHSEPRVIMKALGYNSIVHPLIMVCTYSPCTNCANIIIDSGIVKGIVWEVLTQHDQRGSKYLCDAMPALSGIGMRSWLAIQKEEGDTFDILRRWSNPTSED